MKKIKKSELPMEFNPLLNKFEPVLPLRKKSLNIEKDRNWWAFWYLVIITISLILTIILALVST